MKYKQITWILLIGFLTYGCMEKSQDILKKTCQKLLEINKVQYRTNYMNFINPWTGELGKSDSALVYLDFNSRDTIIGAQYLFSARLCDYGFNGSTWFCSMKSEKQLTYNQVKTSDDLWSPFLTFSLSQLRYFLPHMLKDSCASFNRMTDTIINGTNCYKFGVTMKRKSFNPLKCKFVSVDSDRDFLLLIGKKDFLPRQFVSLVKKNSPVWVVGYDNFNFSAEINDSLFNYQNRDHDFIKMSEIEFIEATKKKTIAKDKKYDGNNAPDWELPGLAGNTIRLSKIKSNLVMLDFWFPYCSGCIASIPDINEIHEKYKKKGLVIYGIEFTRPDSAGLATYISKTKMKYPILYSGKKVASSYGVTAGSTIFLIKNSKIVYARSGFIKDELVQKIEENINPR